MFFFIARSHDSKFIEETQAVKCRLVCLLRAPISGIDATAFQTSLADDILRTQPAKLLRTFKNSTR